MSKLELFTYLQSRKYTTYARNEAINAETSDGVFHREVVSRIKLELMGQAIIESDNVFTGFNGSTPTYSPISSLVVPSTLLSATTSTYVSYSTNGVLFNDTSDRYLEKKLKDIIRIQSVGGSVLLKLVDDNMINLYTPLSYFTVYNEFIQDKVESYNIFNLVDDTEDRKVYLIESHMDTLVTYRYIQLDKEDRTIKYLDTDIEGLTAAVDDDGVIYSFEVLPAPVVTEVLNTVYNGYSDYTEDCVALLRELVVINTLNSQALDKVANPLLSIPESALEYDEDGTARVNLTDRVVVLREGEGKVEQIALETKVQEAMIHKDTLEKNIFSSLAVNKTILGLSEVSTISGNAMDKQMVATVARIEEKRNEAAHGLETLLGVEVSFQDVIPTSVRDKVETLSKAVEGGLMSQEKAVGIVSGEDDWKVIQGEAKVVESSLNKNTV